MKVLDTDFARSFIRMCNDGWVFGWHESNGGNASYRLRPEEVAEVRTNFRSRPWVRIDTEIPTLAGEFFLITSAGGHFRNITHEPKRTLGIIEIDRTGTCWRECWGFKDGTHPTSELTAHLINHEVRKAATHGTSRVIYHCHPSNLAAMTCVVPHDSAVFTRTLWAHLAECALVCREGVEVIGWEVPGSLDLAIESAKVMERTNVVIWPHHGLFVAADTMDEAFGTAHTVEKAAEIFCKARACGLPSASRITDDDLVSFSREYDLGLSRRNVYAKPVLGAPKAEPAVVREPSHQVTVDDVLAAAPGLKRRLKPKPEPAPEPTPDPVGAGLPAQTPAANVSPVSGSATTGLPAQPQPNPGPRAAEAIYAMASQGLPSDAQPQPQPTQSAQSNPATQPAQPAYHFYPKPLQRR